MIRIDGLGVRNLRSLIDSGLIALKPINILVGRNSAGKSTFARLLPLLKQSSERRKKTPILWYGRLVDFGNYEDVRSTLASEGLLEVSLRFEVDTMIFLRRGYWRDENIPLEERSFITATFRLAQDAADGSSQLRELKLDVFEASISLQFDRDVVTSVLVDGEQIEIPSNIRLNWLQGQLMPILRNVNIAPNVPASLSDESLFHSRRVSRFGAARVRSSISAFVHGNTQEERKEEIADRLPIAPIAALHKFCTVLPGTTVTWKSIIAQTPITSGVFRKLHGAVILYKLDLLLAVLDDAAQRQLAEVSYLEPLRATAQRYYRREEISTDELDAKGLNTPFFIQGLTAKERESLQAWTSENFGFILSVKNIGGHLSLNIQHTGDNSPSRNMADVGLGYSQLVPVAVQLWSAKHRMSKLRRTVVANRTTIERTPAIVVVEQPELHLHPAYQAKIADVLAAITDSDIEQKNEAGSRLMIIAETHSPSLVSRLGELIYEKKLSPEAVQILVFEDSSEVRGATKIRKATFDEKGVLKNWPIGFFEA